MNSLAGLQKPAFLDEGISYCGKEHTEIADALGKGKVREG